ncbi:putative serine protease F56F10.1 [Diabrotica undecimpunctata]|uniref:putative serine protease F56F10.1 n=1 Tax=Diabrotica undecimpunctata TaxID=50387 RepID=UPI003B63850A
MLQPENDDLEPSNYERWFTQNLDHFNPNDERTWQQRYFVNDEFASGKGNLAFLQIEGEATANSVWMSTGSWITYARKYKPILFELEHRYYGKSHPTEDLSTENLIYLTSQQALADLAFFIESMNQKHNLTRDVKWIVFGGSYAGNLAAWVRMKYPHLVHGAMSASAPLLAKLDFPEFLKDVEDSLRANNKKCFTTLKQSVDQVEVPLQTAVGQKHFNKLFNLCEDKSENVHNSLDMYNLVTKSQTLDWLCKMLLFSGPEINHLGNIRNIIFGRKCLTYNYDKMISQIDNNVWEDFEGFGGNKNIIC